MRVISIAAVAENGVIGKDNDLIWNLPDDMKFFRKTTLNKVVLMGRRNYQSIPEQFCPLPQRLNIILSRDKSFEAPGAYVFSTIEEALDFCKAKNQDEIYVIGGGQIYKLAIEKNLIDEMYITRVHASFEGDTHYPDFDESQWTTEVISEHGIDEKHNYAFTIEHWIRK